MDISIVLNMQQSGKKSNLFMYCLVVAVCFMTLIFTLPAFATLLTVENKNRIELAVWKYAVNRTLLLETTNWFRELTEGTRESAALAQLSRLEFMQAQLEANKERRLLLFKSCLATANRSIALNADDAVGLFWKAAAMGKMAEDSGILNALRMLRPMERILLRVISLDEKYENAGGHRALGRMYHQLPGFPLSFGSNQKALKHLKQAYELFPKDIITRAFYAEVLYDVGRKEEARKHADFVLAAFIADEDALEYAEYVGIARSIIKKIVGSGMWLEKLG